MVDEISAELFFGSESIVGPAAEREVVLAVLAALGVGMDMVELEGVRFAAALSGGSEVRAAPGVALEDGAAESGWDVSPALARCFRLRSPLRLRGSIPLLESIQLPLRLERGALRRLAG